MKFPAQKFILVNSATCRKAVVQNKPISFLQETLPKQQIYDPHSCSNPDSCLSAQCMNKSTFVVIVVEGQWRVESIIIQCRENIEGWRDWSWNHVDYGLVLWTVNCWQMLLLMMVKWESTSCFPLRVVIMFNDPWNLYLENLLRKYCSLFILKCKFVTCFFIFSVWSLFSLFEMLKLARQYYKCTLGLY